MHDDGEFGRQLRQLRRARDLTQDALAQAAFCALDTIKKIEAGRRRPSRQLAAQLADVLGLDATIRPGFLAAARAIVAADAQPPADMGANDGGDTPDPSTYDTGGAAGAGLPPLPRYPLPLVGREQDLALIANLIAKPSCRLITLLGPGGIGKTRLALQAAVEQAAAFPDGVAFIALAGLGSAEGLASAIATALGLKLTGQADSDQQILRYLQHKELLLVLDNFEHLLEGAAFVADIVQGAPHVVLIVTSRERLNLQSEWLVNMGGLAVPSRGTDGLEEAGAVALFLQTVRRILPGFEPSVEQRDAIVRICELTEGMPLALELAAAWVRALSCGEIAAELERSLAILTSALRDLPSRHRSLQAVFDHSWQLLTAEEQRAFAGCSVFRGGFTREAAAAVSGAMLATLSGLVDKSLLRYDQRRGRYEIHELARQYAAARLDQGDDRVRIRSRHLQFYAQLAEEAEPGIREGVANREWYTRLTREYENISAALDWALAGGDVADGLRIVGALWEFWAYAGYAHVTHSYAERFLARPEAAAPTMLRAKALLTAGTTTFYLGYYQDYVRHCEDALPLLIESAAIARAHGAAGKLMLAIALANQGFVQLNLGRSNRDNLAEGKALALQCLELGRQLASTWIQGHAHCQLGWVTQSYGEMDAAHRHFLAEAECFRPIGAQISYGSALLDLGNWHYEQGEHTQAWEYFVQSLAIFRDYNDRLRIARSLRPMAAIAAGQGKRAAAEELTDELHTIEREVGLGSGHLLDRPLQHQSADKAGHSPNAHATDT